ncbi:MAG TPA: response regulator transcription factor [Actinomycetes bacterium]|nr:response regulator transcription factor [Actinomycetes bacterium]
MTMVLLAEDDAAISDPLARALRRQGYDVNVAESGPDALSGARGCDLVVLDLGLPGMDGLEVCRTLRLEGSQVPVLVLTARGSEIDAVVGLDAGADDYVSKPFRTAELMARIRALLRRGRAPSEGLQVQDIEIDTSARRAWQGAQELGLSQRQFDLLVYLVARRGQVVSREEIMRQVWHVSWFASTKTVDMHISWLRKALGESPSNPRYITTIRGVGFRFEEG